MAPSKISRLVDRTNRLVDRTKRTLSPAPRTLSQAVGHPQGLDVVSEGQNPIVDIVALHGLNGHREKTWTAKNGVHWLRDLLPEDLPQARILCWGYDANTHASDRVNSQYLHNHARTLVSDLYRKRKLTNGGNGVQLGQFLVNVASLFVAADARLLKHLERDSEWLQQQQEQYGPISNDFVTKYAYEQYETPTVLGRTIKRHRNDYSASIWLNARDETSLKHSFRNAAVRILREHPDLSYMEAAVSDQDGDASLAVRRWLDEPANERWLLIYDNYDHPKMGGDTNEAPTGDGGDLEWHDEAGEPVPEGYDIRQYFPDTDHGAVIVTTRSSTVQIGELLRLRKLQNIEDSLRILESTSGRTGARDVLPMIDSAAVDLARKLDGLPLALSTAGTYLKEVSTSWGQYLQDHTTEWGQLQKLSPQLRTYENRTLYSTWNISYASVRRQNESAAMLLRLWAFFDKEDLWYELLRAGCTWVGPKWLQDLTETRLAFEESMRLLCSHGLVEAHSITAQRRPESRGYSVHACVHSWMIHVLNDANERVLAVPAMECISLHERGEEIREYWVIERRLLPHADRCRQLLDEVDDDESIPWISTALGKLYMDQARYKEAEAMYKRALEVFEKARGLDDTWTLNLVNELASTYLYQGRYNEAADMYERALRGREKVLGTEHISTLETVSNLGNVYVDRERFEEAEVLYKRALECHERAFGPEDTSTLGMVLNLGNVYMHQGRYKEAEVMKKRVLEGHEKVLWGRGHPSTLLALGNLGVVYENQGRYDESEVMYKRALEGSEKARGLEHTSTLQTVNNLGTLYRDQGRYVEAEAMYDRALEGYEKVLGPEYRQTLIVANNLGKLYQKQGRHKEAEVMHKPALEGYEKLLGPEHRQTLNVANNIGDLFQKQGRHKEAEVMHKRAGKQAAVVVTSH
ncbi:hypothetical protein B0J18DRAFT_366270 [Chaetomium sp. MPI-SDFR-AT-0129]|nr:hypothetical protein B0J18DRAFT_366270 [Chaetomium sp. MPI-SDFR-AT-0129]